MVNNQGKQAVESLTQLIAGYSNRKFLSQVLAKIPHQTYYFPGPVGQTPVKTSQELDHRAKQSGDRAVPVATSQMETQQITGVTVDSFQVQPGSLFIALPGLRTHGAKYALTAVNKGAVAVLTDQAGQQLIAQELAAQPSPADCVGQGFICVTVDDPRAKAGIVAANLYDQPGQDLDLYAVTGTNGKTTTAFMLEAMLAEQYPNTPSFLTGTVETRIGQRYHLSQQTTVEGPVLQQLLGAARWAGTQYGVVEASSHALQLHRLAGTHFKVAGFTNLAPEHLDFHGDLDGYLAAKARLFSTEYADFGVICVDSEGGQKLAATCPIPHCTVSVLSDRPADWRVTELTQDLGSLQTKLKLVGPDREYQLVSPILGRVIAQDIAVAFIMALQGGVTAAAATAGLAKLNQIPGRMIMLGGKDNGLPLVINDFAHTPDAIEVLLNGVRELTGGKVHVLVACDGDRQDSHRATTGQVAAKLADVLWVTDCNPRSEVPAAIRAQILDGIRTVRPNLHDVHEIKTWRTDAVREAILAANPGDVVVSVAKGSESYQEIAGVKHRYDEQEIMEEVLAAYPRIHRK